jgi:hypothetical protein
MAKEKVVVSGDFKQLAPIVPTKQQAIFDSIGKSVFVTAGIDLDRQPMTKRVTMLEEQYRMEDPICQLITRMYKGHLRTSKRLRANLPIPAPFNTTLTIIDTSSVGPFANRDVFKSRYNVMNALAIRNLCRHFADKGCLTSNRDIGVATPYTAQAKLLRQALAEFGDNLQAGTVHRYQGDEKTVMVLDIPDSGEHRAGYFLEGTTLDHPGSLLFNVGLSRAKEHLIVCANLGYLDSKLPGGAILREILFQMQRKGSVVDVRDVLALYPVVDDLRKLGKQFDLSAEAEQTGLFNESEFDQVILADLEQAQHSIAIYSGFITPQRVASYEATFRRKLGEGVRIRCVTRPPRKNGSIAPEDGKAALDGLERMACVVDTRGDIHEKAVLIDEKVIWFGSLNPLSYSMGTSEMMVRAESETMALAFAALLALERGAKAEKMKGATTKAENPRCEDCGARCAWMKGKYGPYWECEDCGWKQNHGAARRGAGQKQTAPPHGEDRVCSKCGRPMKLRNGRFGNFYGCTGYPGCNHHEKA